MFNKTIITNLFWIYVVLVATWLILNFWDENWTHSNPQKFICYTSPGKDIMVESTGLVVFLILQLFWLLEIPMSIEKSMKWEAFEIEFEKIIVECKKISEWHFCSSLFNHLTSITYLISQTMTTHNILMVPKV